MEAVSFITTDSGDDLIVSFAIPGTAPMQVKSLILLRTPRFEGLLDTDERGVTVSYDDYPNEDDDFLQVIALRAESVDIITTRRRYTLNVQKVDEEDLKEAREVLKQMNFDQRFVLRLP